MRGVDSKLEETHCAAFNLPDKFSP
jgi:hypothetical protein